MGLSPETAEKIEREKQEIEREKLRLEERRLINEEKQGRWWRWIVPPAILIVSVFVSYYGISRQVQQAAAEHEGFAGCAGNGGEGAGEVRLSCHL